ncbi:MAG: hypothetical protein IJ636_06285, partial [Bacteroidales bacterium]|nr:hypothetical protein [Bacteroidales bacterium]
MRKTRAILILLVLALLVPHAPVPAQSLRRYENQISTDDLKKTLEYLANEMTEGRASGTTGKTLAEHFLVEQF